MSKGVIPRWLVSGINKHADFCMQLDASTGEIVEALRSNGLLENTVIIASSDNGTSASTSQHSELKQAGHSSSADLRGFKADAWDGGHRVPFIVSWKGRVQSGSRSDVLVSLNDVLATMAQLLGSKLPADAGEDSVSFLSVLDGGEASRSDVIHHSISGHFAIRRGKWKLLMCPGSGGWTNPKPTPSNWLNAEKNGSPMVQLYDMELDKGEHNNLAAEKPELVKELRELLEKQIKNGRSTSGPIQKNDTSVMLIKDPRTKSAKSK